MSQQTAPPSLDQYPGYFPAAEPPFWTRAKVGVACGVLGLVVGAAMGSGLGEGSEPTSRASVDQAVDEATADLERQLADSEAALRDQAKESKAELRQARETLAEVKRQARIDKRKAVAAAKSRVPASPTSPDISAFVGTPRKPDPRFDTCSAANAAGYGTYIRGLDPEYDWYEDRDNDGLVCET